MTGTFSRGRAYFEAAQTPALVHLRARVHSYRFEAVTKSEVCDNSCEPYSSFMSKFNALKVEEEDLRSTADVSHASHANA